MVLTVVLLTDRSVMVAAWSCEIVVGQGYVCLHPLPFVVDSSTETDRLVRLTVLALLLLLPASLEMKLLLQSEMA